MSLPKILTIFVVFVLAIAGIVYATINRLEPKQNGNVPANDESQEHQMDEIADEQVNRNEQEMPISPPLPPTPPAQNETAQPQVTFTGEILAGNTSPVINFNPADYQKALSGKTLVVLYFYANWCPICREEIPKMYSAFDELNEPEVVAFRVNFNDSETDNNEEDLAREFGIAYQHTKVILKNGERTLKSPETWDKDRYLSEINSALAN